MKQEEIGNKKGIADLNKILIDPKCKSRSFCFGDVNIIKYGFSQ